MSGPGGSLQWRKSSRSSNGTSCVEVASTASAVLTRDSKDISGPTLTFSPMAWSVFLASLKVGPV